MMRQRYGSYTAADQRVWKVLFTRQTDNLQDKASEGYLSCLDSLGEVLHENAIPRFDELGDHLKAAVDWSIEVVPGHIPVNDFFRLLSDRKFPSSTWLRSMDQLDYLEEPDMFHDIYGHIPLLIDEKYAEFMEHIGKLGTRWAGNEKAVSALRSLYWFTIEFGLLRQNDNRRIYGAGILSSFGESIQVIEASVECIPFDIGHILHTDFRTDQMQEVYYEAGSYSEFLASIDEVENILQLEFGVQSQR